MISLYPEDKKSSGPENSRSLFINLAEMFCTAAPQKPSTAKDITNSCMGSLQGKHVLVFFFFFFYKSNRLKSISNFASLQLFSDEYY